MFRTFLPWATALALWVHAAEARADRPIRLSVIQEATACPSARELASQVLATEPEARLTADDAQAASVAVSFHGDATSGFHAEVQLDSPGSPSLRRSVDGATCESVGHAVAIIAALHARQAQPASSPTAASMVPAREPLQHDLVVGGGVRSGVGRGVAAYGKIGYGLEVGPHGSVHAAALYSLDQASTLPITLLASQIDACPFRLGSTRLSATACVRVELGARLRNGAFAHSMFWGAGGGAARVRARVSSHVSLQLDGGLVAPARFGEFREMADPSDVARSRDATHTPVVVWAAGLSIGGSF